MVQLSGLAAHKKPRIWAWQATELNHLTKPFKIDLQLANHRWKFDKCRVSRRVTVKRSEGRARMTWIGVCYLMKAG